MKRSPQLTLPLEVAPPTDELAIWRDGHRCAYLGGFLTLRLASGREAAARIASELHITLPPEARPRQIRDLSEAWLRDEARRLIGAELARQAAQRDRDLPRWRLSFAARSHWAWTERDGKLHVHWRLIEQPTEVIAQVVGRVVTTLPTPLPLTDLFVDTPVCACA